MTRTVVRVALLAVVGLLVAGFVAVVRPGERELTIDLLSLGLGALILFVLVYATQQARKPEGPSLFDDALTSARPRSSRLPELDRVEREVILGCARAFDLHYRLRPTLREIAGHRLAARRGIALDGDPERAAQALGAQAWDVLRPDREPPRLRHGPGLPRAELRPIVERLEEL